jgi:proteasome maturation protein
LDLLKKTQGIHAPLRVMIERKIASGVGRLPFLKSSNLMLDVLEGRQEYLDFSDFFKGTSVTTIIFDLMITISI